MYSLERQLNDISLLEIAALLHLVPNDLLKDIVALIASKLFLLYRKRPIFSAWTDQICSLWHKNFIVTDMLFGGVRFEPDHKIRLKRRVVACFTHYWHLERSGGTNVPGSKEYAMTIEFFGRTRDVEKMRQRTLNMFMQEGKQPFGIIKAWSNLIQIGAASQFKFQGLIYNDQHCHDCKSGWCDYHHYFFNPARWKNY